MILKAKLSDAKAIANIHVESLSSGFLAKLGVDFLVKLYIFLIKKEIVLVYKEQGVTLAFISCSHDSARMMKVFLLSAPQVLLVLLRKIFQSPSLLLHITETFFLPFKSKQIIAEGNEVVLPAAELLSISVHPNCQHSGIGHMLIDELETQLKLNGIYDYKVIAGDSLKKANSFYLKNKFTYVAKIIVHDKQISNVYVKNLTIKK